MKKILIIVFAILLFISCTGGVNYFISIKKGDIRKTYTTEYVLIERCEGVNIFGELLWKNVSVVKKDTINIRNIEQYQDSIEE